MTKFIKLHWRDDGVALYLNVETIDLIQSDTEGAGAALGLKNSQRLAVQESPDQVAELISA